MFPMICIRAICARFTSQTELIYRCVIVVSLTRWNEVCLMASYAVHELLYAWQQGAINADAVAVCRNVGFRSVELCPMWSWLCEDRWGGGKLQKCQWVWRSLSGPLDGADLQFRSFASSQTVHAITRGACLLSWFLLVSDYTVSGQRQSWKTPRWVWGKQVHRMWYFPSVLWHCWLGDRKGIRPEKKTGCWFVGGDDLTGALHVL